MTPFDAALAAGCGGLLCLERKALVQLMLARPLVVATIIAAILGDAHTGLRVGLALELFFLGTASYGASTPEHETLAAIFAASLATSAAGESIAPPPTLAVAALLGLPFARLGRLMEAALERRNETYVDRAAVFLAEGRLGPATRQGLPALLSVFALGAGVTLAGTLAGLPIRALELRLPEPALHILSLAWFLFVGVAAAQALRAIQTTGGGLLSGIAALTVFFVFALSTLFGG